MIHQSCDGWLLQTARAQLGQDTDVTVRPSCFLCYVSSGVTALRFISQSLSQRFNNLFICVQALSVGSRLANLPSEDPPKNPLFGCACVV